MYRKFEYILHMRKYEPVIVLFQSFVKNPSSSLSWIEPITSSLFLTCTENCSGATNFTVLRCSDATVTGSVLDFASQDEHGRQGGNGNVEEELPRISQAEQVQVA